MSINENLETVNQCRYCEKTFRKESSLAVHLCEPKRRYQQQNETGVQFGLRSYLQFYETTQGSARLKSYEDFVNSPYYNAFVRYGRYLVAVRAINVTSFTAWLLKNNKKLDQWCRDSYYEEWLSEYIRREAAQDADRAISTMTDRALALLPPAMTLCFGAIAGFVLFSMMSAILSVNDLASHGA